MNDNVAVLHNGVINCVIKDKKMSDTAAFVRDYLGNLPRNWQDNEFLWDMVEDYCSGSKLVVLTNDPEAEYSAYIINESSGHWADGVWYSNSSYSCAKPKSFVSYNSARLSAEVFEDEDTIKFPECMMCGEESVLDDICYTCESCQLCWMTEEECKCDGFNTSFHAMTAEQFNKFYNE
jgi:hypothetical protein